MRSDLPKTSKNPELIGRLNRCVTQFAANGVNMAAMSDVYWCTEYSTQGAWLLSIIVTIYQIICAKQGPAYKSDTQKYKKSSKLGLGIPHLNLKKHFEENNSKVSPFWKVYVGDKLIDYFTRPPIGDQFEPNPVQCWVHTTTN